MEEILDIVDREDHVIRQASRDEIYKKGLSPEESIRVVNLLVFNDKQELLLPQRSFNRKLFPGRYDFSCGEHVMAGEDYDVAAQRGLREELGISAPLHYLGKLSPLDSVSSFMKVYSVIHNGPFSQYDREGIASLQWIDIPSLKQLLRHPEQFKSDVPPVLHWYFTHFS